jgi:HEAT repeat protein
LTNNGDGPTGAENPDLPAPDDERIPLPSADAVLDEIAAGRMPPYEHLSALANPSDAIVARMFELWPRLQPERRRELLATLHQITEEDATADFHRFHLSALHDADPATRMLAVRGLWEQDRPDYMRLLARQLREDPEPNVRAEVADALGRWAISVEFGLISEDDAEDLTTALREAIEDIEEQDEVRGRALEALGAWSDESVAELISEMYEVGNQRLRVAALRAMGRNASDSWLPILIYHFDDDDSEVRAAAATSAGELLSDDAVVPLTMLIEDPDEDVQVAAVLALGEIANEEAERILTRMLRERQEPHLRTAVREALAGVQLLTMALQDDADRDPEFEGPVVADDDEESDE